MPRYHQQFLNTSCMSQLFVIVLLSYWLSLKRELEHQQVKHFYVHTNKTFGFKQQITNQECHEWFLQNARLQEKQKRETGKNTDGSPAPKCCQQYASPITIDNDPLPNIAPNKHHQISESTRSFKHIPKFVSDNAGDPALHVSHPNLLLHIQLNNRL